MINSRIIEHHGRIENIKLFNVDPTPYIKEAKEKEIERVKAVQEAARVKALAEANGEEVEETKAAPAAPDGEQEQKDEGPDYF